MSFHTHTHCCNAPGGSLLILTRCQTAYSISPLSRISSSCNTMDDTSERIFQLQNQPLSIYTQLSDNLKIKMTWIHFYVFQLRYTQGYLKAVNSWIKQTFYLKMLAELSVKFILCISSSDRQYRWSRHARGVVR